MNQTISVIIPVYNVAPYLPRCLDSVVSQSYGALEILLIDDGSTDGSGRICDEYAVRDPRIRVIHQPNGGAGAAKNTGLRSASGVYLEPGAYAHMAGLLAQTGADLVQCAYRDVYRGHTVDRIKKPGQRIWSGEAYLALYTRDWTCGLMTDKLYRRNLFEGIFFEEGRRIDDEYFTYQGVMNAATVVCDDRVVYNYRKRGSSVMLSPESAKQILLDRIDCLSKRRIRVAARFPALRRVFDDHFLNMMIILARDPHGSVESITRIKEELRDYFREKGRTVPNIRLWPALARLCLAGPKALLALRGEPVRPDSGDDWFD